MSCHARLEEPGRAYFDMLKVRIEQCGPLYKSPTEVTDEDERGGRPLSDDPATHSKIKTEKPYEYGLRRC